MARPYDVALDCTMHTRHGREILWYLPEIRIPLRQSHHCDRAAPDFTTTASASHTPISMWASHSCMKRRVLTFGFTSAVTRL